MGMIGYIVIDRPDCPFAAKKVLSSTREPRQLDRMCLLRSVNVAWRSRVDHDGPRRA